MALEHLGPLGARLLEGVDRSHPDERVGKPDRLPQLRGKAGFARTSSATASASPIDWRLPPAKRAMKPRSTTTHRTLPMTAAADVVLSR